jgi:hypothetical protein
MPLEKLGELLASEYRGPKAGFSQADVVKALMRIGESGAIGRSRLSSLLNLGQGEIRTLIKRLKVTRLIRVGMSGCELTEQGKKEFALISKTISWRSEVKGNSLGIGEHCWAFLVKNRATRVRLGIEQRDAAIRAGASGVLTLLYSGGHFLIPVEGTDCERTTLEPWQTIRRASPEEGDVVIVSGAKDSTSAENGGWSAVLTLV